MVPGCFFFFSFLAPLLDQSVIINTVNQPTSVVLDIHERYLYWANSGDGTIERSYTDGTERKVVIGQGLDEPNTIVLDHLNGYVIHFLGYFFLLDLFA